MYSVRLWSVRHARGLAGFYQWFEGLLCRLHPLFKRIGYERLERPVAAVERNVKGLLFDCRMCGSCVLSSTGLSCPMNCPKQLRNGPCGGVRANGNCEVKPEMRCVWLNAEERSRTLPLLPRSWRQHFRELRPPVDNRLSGTSSWANLLNGRDKVKPNGWQPDEEDAAA